MRRDGTQTNGGLLYLKTTGVTLNTGWLDLATASGATAALPPGTVTTFAGSSAPSGWLVCDGSAILRSTYSTLLGVIGTTYGAGDGSTTFNLPDLRGRVPVGYAASGGHVDVSTLGNNDGVVLANRRAKHRHTVTDPGHVHNLGQVSGSGSSLGASLTGGQADVTSAGVVRPAATTGISIGAATDSLDAPAYLVLNHIIKT